MEKALATQEMVRISLGGGGSEITLTPPLRDTGMVWYGISVFVDFQTVTAMDVILNCRALFDLIQKLAFKVLSSAPFQT